MTNTNPYCVRELTKLLRNGDETDLLIKSFIRKSESIINPLLAKLYLMPIQKKIDLTGLITVVADDEIVTGINTLFLSEVFPGQMLRVNANGEALRVLSIESNTNLTVEFLVGGVTDINDVISYPGKPILSASNSSFIIIPDWLVTATEYETARLMMMNETADRAREKEDAKRSFLDEYEMIAKPIIENIKSGQYFDSSLKSQLNENNSNRLVYINSDNSSRDRIDRNNDIYNSGSFI